MVRKKVKISIVMGSQSDWKTLQKCQNVFKSFDLLFEKKIISAHRTPNRLYEYANNLSKSDIQVVIAGAGGAAHLPGMIASMTTIPVLGVPIQTKTLSGIDSLLSIVQMPYGIPLPTLAIGEAGAKNAALSAVSILGLNDEKIKKKLERFRIKQTKSIKKVPQ